MTYNLPQAAASVVFLSTANKHAQTGNRIAAQKHNELLIKAGANVGGKRRNKKKGGRKSRRKKGGSKSCGCSGVPTTITTYTAGSSNTMSPNPNDNIAAAQQLMANTLCAGSLDSMGDSWSGGGTRKKRGGTSALGTFVENLNNMNGGKKRRVYRSKSKKKSMKKKKTRKRRHLKFPRLKGLRKHLFYKNKNSRGKRVTGKIVRKYPKLFSKKIKKKYRIRH